MMGLGFSLVAVVVVDTAHARPGRMGSMRRPMHRHPTEARVQGTNPTAAGGAGATAGTGIAGDNTTTTGRGSAGGGGGGVGRIRINTADGLYIVSVNSLIRGVTTTGTVGRR